MGGSNRDGAGAIIRLPTKHDIDISYRIQRVGEARIRTSGLSVAAHQEQATGRPPFVVHVDGDVAANGNAIGLHIVRSEQGPVDICLRTEDVQYMVSILLALSCEARRRQPRPEVDAPPSGAIPLPLSAINVGQDDSNQT